ncbi:MAG TPA: methyltransferase domain-containing protein [Candidatus Kapabacteria bacterium]|nr:methyltransferase domain-containing protein [Candidatus Kapabacteria bacterium]
MNIFKIVRSRIKNFIYDYIYIPIFFFIVYFRDLKKIKKIFGEFESLSKKEQKSYTLVFENQASNICGILVPEIVKMVSDLKIDPNKVLLDGDDKSVVDQVKNRFDFKQTEVITAGIGNNFNYFWNFEDDFPENMPSDFDLIISQAMFEHLINPYKHFEDLSKLLRKGGYLAIHSHLPGYTYHRYPIDSVRFFPDWFEFSAKKTGLSVERKFLRNFHLIYLFQK